MFNDYRTTRDLNIPRYFRVSRRYRRFPNVAARGLDSTVSVSSGGLAGAGANKTRNCGFGRGCVLSNLARIH
jgi:hypothetical protein